MSKTQISMLVFGIYLAILGLALMFFPQIISYVFTSDYSRIDMWTRMIGMLVLITSTYYIASAIYNIEAFFRLSIFTRLSAILVLIGFVVFLDAQVKVITVWVPDLVGAIWTWLTLSKENLHIGESVEILREKAVVDVIVKSRNNHFS